MTLRAIRSIILDCIDNKTKDLIYLRTGGGKTYSSLMTLYELTKDGKKCIFVVPYISIKKDILSAYPFTSEKERSGKVYVCCPEALQYKDVKKYDIIVIDEIHLIPKSNMFRDIYKGVISDIMESDIAVIGLTGTKIYYQNFLNMFNQIHDLGLKNKNSVTIQYWEDIPDPKIFANMMSDLYPKNSLFYANKKFLDEYFGPDIVFTSEIIKYPYLDQVMHGRQIVKNVINKQAIVGNKWFATDCFTCGINIKTPLDNLVLSVVLDDTVTTLDIVQIINRFRHIEGDILVNIFSWKPTIKSNDIDTKKYKSFRRAHGDMVLYLSDHFETVNIKNPSSKIRIPSTGVKKSKTPTEIKNVRDLMRCVREANGMRKSNKVKDAHELSKFLFRYRFKKNKFIDYSRFMKKDREAIFEDVAKELGIRLEI